MTSASRTAILGALVLVASVQARSAAMGGARSFTITASTQTGWTISYIPHVQPSGYVTIGKQSFALYEQAEDQSNPVGSPALPVDIVTLGMPRGAQVHVELRNVVYETVNAQLVAPRPSYKLNENQEASAEYTPDPVAYGRDAWVPIVQITTGQPFTFREQYLVPIRVSPLQYDPAQQRLRKILRADIVVQWSPATQKIAVSTPPSSDPFAEDAYRGLALNYAQAKQWRSGMATARMAAGDDSTGNWFSPTGSYIKMGVVEDGWYRVPLTVLESLGAAPDLPSARLFQKGREIPAYVEGDSVISFYGYRNRGDSTYDDLYSDTGYVWLSWGGSAGRRYNTVGSPSSVQHVVTSTLAKYHFEKNLSYYVGTGYDEITNTYDVPGEGWAWEYYYPGTTIDHSFVLDNIDSSIVKSATVSARLYSTTSPVSTPDHIASVTLNGAALGQIPFNGRTGAWPSFVVPASLLTASNTLRIQSIPTATSVNQFYLDWFDVTYERALVAVNEQLRFDVLPADAAPSARFRVAGLPSADVLVMDLSLGRRLMPDSTTSDGGGTFTVVFSDTITVPRSYFVATRAVDRLPQSLGAKQFADLRSSTGADYLVISHPLFLSAATALAAERASSLSLRTKVIDVTDIYDEFNYGVLNPIAIKRFLQYAYQHWPTPSPSNVVFFGDASWDPHHYMANTINADFIPAFGVPSSDNWYACFDSATPWVPSLFLGRLPVQTITEANQVVSKITTFDTTPKSEWVKKFLFMTGGSDSGEWADFDAKSDYMISTYIDPSPVGGKSVRAYKMSPGYIDGSMKPQLQAIFADGIEFVSFIGHSGGRIWGLDPGSPYDFQNTNGWWPFVASVSCNVGAFAEPTGGVLAEDFLLADHRGGVGVWASASLGYPTHGTLLVDYFLDFMRNGARSVGELTTVSRIRLWQSLGSDYITIAHQYLTPLIGDPATRLPLPLNPDLALESSDLSIDPSQPTTSDSTVSVAVHVKNFGLVPTAPAELNINDTYKGVSSSVAQNLSIAPVYFVDSLSVPWHPRGRPGQHTLSFSVTLPDSIQEYSTTNNTLTYDRYIYANSLQALRPMNGQMVAPGPVRLVVSAPEGVLSGGTTYAFELDSVSTFDSPFHIASPQVNPLGASGEWTTPALPAGIDVYWRARTVSSSSTSPWINGSFSTSATPPTLPLARWWQHRQDQFAQGTMNDVTASDTGVGITAGPPTLLLCRSVGSRGDMSKDYYSIIQVGLEVITGLWWEVGDSYMAVRVNKFDGSYQFKAFDLVASPANADSLVAFINGATNGTYLGVVAMRLGRTNVDEAMYSAIESLGSQQIRQVQDGTAWALIAQKGNPSYAVEALSADTVRISSQLPTYFRAQKGTIVSPVLPTPVGWRSFQWQTLTAPGKTSVHGYMLGMRQDGGVDSLRSFVSDSLSFDLRSVKADGTVYRGYAFGADLLTTESSVTPRILWWSADFGAPADLAVQSPVHGNDAIIPRGTALQIPLSIYNLGFRNSDSTHIDVGLYDIQNNLQPLFRVDAGGVAVDSARTVLLTVSTASLPPRVVLQATVSPADTSGDLFQGNNSVAYNFSVTGTPQGTIDIFADGLNVMDGDYVAANPAILVRPRLKDAVALNALAASLAVDGYDKGAFVPLEGGQAAFHPALTVGRHDLRILLLNKLSNGSTDTLQRTLNVSVASETQLLQVYNYPNPFSNRTEFTFMLAGSRAPDAGRIRVYTVAGRKILDRELGPGQVAVGYNRIPWDGRDRDGDTIANGVYFYQIEVSTGNKTTTVLGKMAKVR